MRLVVTLLVRDEADVVAATVEHHLAAGADLIVVTDNGSVDGTVEVLERYVAAGVVDLLHEPEQDYDQARWVTRMAERAATRHGADWVVHADADEFWRPLEGWDLAAALAAQPEPVVAVRAPRLNLVGWRGTTGPWVDRLVVRDRLSLSERGTPIGPKVCHRGRAGVCVAQGNHAVEGLTGTTAEQVLEVLHVPARSYRQFARKIRNGAESYERNTRLPADVGWHWRADQARLLAGTLVEEYESRLPVPGDDPGRWVADPLLRDRLHGLATRAVLPAELAAVLTSP